MVCIKETNLERAKGEIREILVSARIPYADVICYKGEEEILRLVYGENATGTENLQMFSCSKPVTSFAAMQLVERGLLGLDDDVEKYLPEIGGRYLIDERGNKVEPKNKMTVRNLLTMTAGFTYNTRTAPILELQKKNPDAVLRDFISAFVATPMAFEAGTKFEYSLCYDVLAAVIEAATKTKFSAFVQENIFEPLGMKKSFFDNREASFPQKYYVNEKGEMRPCGEENELILTKNYESGGAGLVSTVEDYAEFAKCLWRGGVTARGERILGEKYLKQLSSEQVSNGSVKNEFTCVQGADYGYGFGVRVRKTDTPWGLKRGEFGWDGAAGSYSFIDPNENVVIVMGMNLLGWPNVFTGKHVEIVRAIYENLIC